MGWFEEFVAGGFCGDGFGTSAQAGSGSGRKRKIGFEKYVAIDAKGAFSWPIPPAGFELRELLDLARLRAWTLKPARSR